MTRTVVVPLDGSPASEHALGPAREIAARFGGPMMLFANAGDDHDQVAAYLDGHARALGDPPVTTMVHRGFASCGLAEAVRSLPDPLVCMESRLGAGPDDVLGPVAEDVIDAGTAPVVLVGPSCVAPCAVGNGERGLIVCADGSAASSSVEPVAAEWASILGLEVRLITVFPREPHRESEEELPPERVLREVGNLAFRLERHGLRVHVDQLDDSDPAFAITAYAAAHPTALIAASVRGHRHALHHVVGDTIVHIVRLAPVPVLVSRPVTATFHA